MHQCHPSLQLPAMAQENGFLILNPVYKTPIGSVVPASWICQTKLHNKNRDAGVESEVWNQARFGIAKVKTNLTFVSAQSIIIQTKGFCSHIALRLISLWMKKWQWKKNVWMKHLARSRSHFLLPCHRRKVFCPLFRYLCSREEENWMDAGNATIQPSHVIATITQPPPPTIVHNIHRLLLYCATEVIHLTQSEAQTTYWHKYCV